MRTAARLYAIDKPDVDPPALALGLLVLPAGDRWRIQPIYHDRSLRPLGQLEGLTTTADHPDALLDACVAFYPEAFACCITLPTVRTCVGTAMRLDLSEDLPVGWPSLRAEARSVFARLPLRQAEVRVRVQI